MAADELNQAEQQAPESNSATSFYDISHVVLAWPTEMRIALLHQIIRSFTTPAEILRRKKGTLQEVMERPSTGLPAPTDEEVEQMLNQHGEVGLALDYLLPILTPLDIGRG